MGTDNKLDILLIERGIFEEAKAHEILKLEKQIELEIIRKSTQNTIVQKSILVALIGLFATLIAAIISGIYSKIIEKDRYYSSLVIESLKAESPEEKAFDLNFLISTGLIENHNHRIEKLVFGGDSTNSNSYLSKFSNSKNTNLQEPFSIKTRFDLTYFIKKDTLHVKLLDLFIAQVRPRPLYPTTIYGIKLLLLDYDYEYNKKLIPFSQSELIPLNILFKNKSSIEYKELDFEIPLEQDYYSEVPCFICLEIEEFYDGQIGLSYTYAEEEIILRDE